MIDPIYEKRKLVGYAKITRDISERQQVLADLHASENQFKLLVSGVTDYALYMLTPAGIVANWNAGGQRIKGYAPEEIIGQEIFHGSIPLKKIFNEEEGWRVRKDGFVLLGERGDRPDPRRRRAAGRLCQDHPRHLRTPGGAAAGWRRCSGSWLNPRRWMRSAS